MNWRELSEKEMKIKKLSQISLMPKQEAPLFEPENTGRYSFQPVSGKSNDDGDTEVTDDGGYSSGFISEVDFDDEEITGPLAKESSLDLFKNIVKVSNCQSIATFNIDVGLDNIQKYSSDDSVGIKKDLRFSTIEKKYDLFYFDFSKIAPADRKYCFNNALAASKPLSAGFIAGIKEEDFNELSKLGFSKSLSLAKNSEGAIFVRKNHMSKISNVIVFDDKNEKKAEFLCDIAATLEDKIAGLQPYHSLKYGAGLIFPYSKPQDVMYHMGSVSFPIDIIFIGSNNKIKKISKNIEPGTQGTYGAADISAVLEISGGASDSLNLQIGDSVSCIIPSQKTIERFSTIAGIDKPSLYLKAASFTRKIAFGGFDIYNMSTDNKTTSEIIKTASAVATQAKANKQLSVYNFDELFSLGLGKLHLSNNYSLQSADVINKNLRIDLELNKSAALSDFLAIKSFTPLEVRKAFLSMRDDLSAGNVVVISTSLSCDLNKLKPLIIKRAMEEVVFDPNVHSINIVSMPTDKIMANTEELLTRFESEKMKYYNVTLNKTAGAPIPDEVKEAASQVVDILAEAKEQLDEISSKFKNNAEQYEKQRGNIQLIEASGPVFQSSSKRISKKIVSFLLNIKKSIKIMGKIKDISSVDEKIDALSLSCKEFVTVAEDIFAMVKKVKEPTFADELKEQSDKIEKSTEDIDNNIKNFSDYILKDILNKKVLSR